MNLSLKAARAAQAANAAAREQVTGQEREDKLSELRIRAQHSKSEGYMAICEYATQIQERLADVCLGTNPETGKIAIAKAQGANEFIEGMRRYFEGADREAAEIEQTAG